MAEKKMKKPAIDWKIAAARIAIGEKVQLKSLEGYWVQPRRFTKQGEAEILAAQTRAIAKSKSIAADIVSRMAPPESDTAAMVGPSAKDRQEIAVKVMEGATADMVGNVELNTMRILYGIEATNMTPDEKPSREWADDIMLYGDVADEILAIVAEQNLPLAVRLSRKSETLPIGSSTAADSTKTAEKSAD